MNKMIWAGEYQQIPHWGVEGQRGFVTVRGCVPCLPGNEWRHDPLTADEVKALKQAADEAEADGWSIWQ